MSSQFHAQIEPASSPVPAFAPASRGLLQRKCACGGTHGVDDMCEACRGQRLTGVQTKLRVNEPGDRYEQEADRIADEVMRMPEPTVQREVVAEEEEADETLQMKPLATQITPLVQREAIPEEEDDEEEVALQRQALTDEKEPEILQTNRTTSHAATLARSTETSTEEPHGVRGHPLDPATRAYMEPRFGRDFGLVRVHADRHAAQSAAALNAVAFTTGHDIAFAAGEYRPGSAAGLQLIAHELVHVVQQAGGSVSTSGIGRVSGRTSPVVQRAGDRSKLPAGFRCNVAESTPGSVWTSVFFERKKADLSSGAIRVVDSFAGLWEAAGANKPVRIDGYASIEGVPRFNWQLSCDRAIAVAGGLNAHGIDSTYLDVFAHGTTEEFPGGRRANRRATTAVDFGGPLESVAEEQEPASEGPQPQVEPERAMCTPRSGILNSECAAYGKESWWLPEAYIHNATCACEETPNVPTANCVREFLQDRLAAVGHEVKVEASHWKGALMGRRVSKDMYINYVQLNLTPIVYKDHVDAYSACCCPSGPADLVSWRGVTTFALPCGIVGESIRRFGSCHGTPGKW